MNHRRKSQFIFAAAVLVVGGLVLVGSITLRNQGEQQTHQPKEVQLTEDGLACGSGTEVDIGDTLNLILNGDPSTGYTWDVGFYAHPVIEHFGEPEYKPASGVPGTAGTYTFRFLAVGEGQVALRMIYHRPQDENNSVIKICDVAVTVKDYNSIE